ncbi:MAG: hypothetical protein OEL75_03005, partial [Kiritimatiellaceae bacterium]|nr:hypothetical protein [Kiritimatiellaceae bacterium]
MDKHLYRKLRAPLERGAVHVAVAIVPRLPRCGVLWMSEICGRLGCAFGRKRQKIGMANLDLVFGDEKTRGEKQAILKKSSVTMARTLIDTFWFAHHPAERMSRYVKIDPSFNSFLEEKPCIGITAHFGN